jgi:hypothetical protein
MEWERCTADNKLDWEYSSTVDIFGGDPMEVDSGPGCDPPAGDGFLDLNSKMDLDDTIIITN